MSDITDGLTPSANSAGSEAQDRSSIALLLERNLEFANAGDHHAAMSSRSSA
jgi:hypothetical protein